MGKISIVSGNRSPATILDAFSTAQSKLDLPLETEIAPVNLWKPNEEQYIRAVQGSH